jgi:hypothetical protein
LLKRPAAIAVVLLTTLAAAGWLMLRPVGPAADMTTAAEAYLATLSAEQRQQSVIPYESAQRLDWHFIPKPHRKGLQIKDMNPQQRQAAHALLKAGLSHVGYDKAVEIMALEIVLHELEKQRGGGLIRDPERYYVTIFGQPGPESTWGWSLEGHHLSLNFALQVGRVLSTTPTFYGANPGVVMHDMPGAPKKGTRVLAKEEELAFGLLDSLDQRQRRKAVVAERAPRDIRAAGEVHPPGDPPQGLPAAEMTPQQQQTLRELIEVYANNLPKPVANARMKALDDAGFEKIHFAWAGATRPGVGHHYVIQGPTFVIELNNTQPDASGNPANHIHSVWRDMRGDFGLPRE